MATHSSIFAWRIPWTEEPGGLQSMGLQRVGHSSETNTTLRPEDVNGKSFQNTVRVCEGLPDGAVVFRGSRQMPDTKLAGKSQYKISAQSHCPPASSSPACFSHWPRSPSGREQMSQWIQCIHISWRKVDTELQEQEERMQNSTAS